MAGLFFASNFNKLMNLNVNKSPFLRVLWNWKYQVAIVAVIVGIYITKYGFFLSYLKAGIWIYFCIGIAFAFLISGLIQKSLSQKYLISKNLRIWIAFPIALLLAHLTEYSSDYVLREYLAYPEYVLHPCAHPPKTESEMIEARSVWKLKVNQDFDCGTSGG